MVSSERPAFLAEPAPTFPCAQPAARRASGARPGVGPLAALVTDSSPEGISAKEAFSHAGPNAQKHGGRPGRRQAVLCSGVGRDSSFVAWHPMERLCGAPQRCTSWALAHTASSGRDRQTAVHTSCFFHSASRPYYCYLSSLCLGSLATQITGDKRQAEHTHR